MQRHKSPQHARESALAVLRTLRTAGHEAYFAGGCVRDELLGLHPADYDVATSATPAQVTALFPHAQHVGASFGVVIVAGGHGQSRTTTEVATFRADGIYSDARRPDAVTFSDKHADAQRRDFTINALFLDPLDDGTTRTLGTAPRVRSHLGGTVIDLVGGLDDLASRTLRAVGDPAQRLAEDHLRALRAIRFAARLDLTIDAATSQAIARDAANLTGVSRERIGDELRRMLLHPSRVKALELIEAHTLDAPILQAPPHRSILARVAALPEPGHTSIPGSTQAFPGERPISEAIYPIAVLAGWLLDREQGDIVLSARRGLCLSNHEAAALTDILDQYAELVREEWLCASIASQKRSIARGGFSEAWWLLSGANDSKSGRSAAIFEVVERHRRSASGIAPEPVLKGDDLVRLGVKSGPLFKIILDRVYDHQLADGFVGDPSPRASAEAMAERMK